MTNAHRSLGRRRCCIKSASMSNGNTWRIIDSGMVGHREEETPPKEQDFLGISVCLIYQSCMEAAKQNSQGLTEEADLEGQRLLVVGTCADRGYSVKGNKISLAIIFSQLR